MKITSTNTVKKRGRVNVMTDFKRLDAAGDRYGKRPKEAASNRPFNDNPYNLWHEDNKNNVQGMTAVAFNWHIAPHATFDTKTGRYSGNNEMASDRIAKILSAVSISRSHQSVVTARDGSEVTVGDGIPPMRVTTIDLQSSDEEQSRYEEIEAMIASNISWRDLLGEDIPAGVIERTDVTAVTTPFGLWNRNP